MQRNEELLVGRDVADTVQLAAERMVQTLSVLKSPSVALAGGRTPAALYSLLTQPPYRDQIAWQNIEWFWGDERSVPPDHADSNYRMACETLLSPLGIRSERIHRMQAERPDRDQAAKEYEQIIRTRVTNTDASGVPVLDLVLLGIGADGHTASLFPESAALNEHQRLVVPNFVPSQQTWRMTMTYPLLNAARHIIFLITGADKAPAIETIFRARLATAKRFGGAGSADEAPNDPNRDRKGAVSIPPAAHILAVSGRISWILDADAARIVATPPTT